MAGAKARREDRARGSHGKVRLAVCWLRSLKPIVIALLTCVRSVTKQLLHMMVLVVQRYVKKFTQFEISLVK